MSPRTQAVDTLHVAYLLDTANLAGRPFAVLLAALAAVVAVVASVRRRRRTPAPEEQPVWNRMLLGVLIVCASVVAGQLPDVIFEAPPDDLQGLGGAVFASGCLLATPLFYQSLVHWNRIRTLLSAPGDWFNGLGAMLVVAAAGNAFLPDSADWHHGVLDWHRQASILLVATSIVLMGTSVTIVGTSGLAKDLRIWVVALAMAGLGIAPGLALLAGPGQADPLAVFTVGSAGLLVTAVALPATPLRPRSANNQETTIGSLVVLSGAVGILILNGDLAPHRGPLVTVYAALAVFGAGARLVQMVRDLAMLAQSRHEARTDELTGIPNRRALMQALGEALDSGVPTTLLLVDLDRFKLVNDRYGHAVGDELLCRVATAFATSVPSRSLLARLGGDEFAVLLTGDAVRHSLHVGWRLVEVVAPHLDPDGRPLQVGASIGVAETRDPKGEGIDAGELLRRADTAMYQAKTSQAGVSIYDGLVDARALAQLRLVEELADVLAPGSPTGEQIQVHFQPQVDVATGEVVGAEALVRWQHTYQGLLGPEHFLDLVEENGLMPLLTARVVNQAAVQWKRWRDAGHRLRVSVNLSASALVHPSLLVVLDDVLAAGVEPDQFVLEITETSLMIDPELALDTMRGIAARGFGFSIDDYGTGYSSLSYLNDLPATELKIDRSFTMRILTDPRTAAIVAGTVELAHRLGMRLIVEGVEDLETLEALHDMGCNEAQGYLHSRPLGIDAFDTWLSRRTAGTRAG